MAKGVTYSHFTKLQDERTAREKQRTLSYSKKEAAVNPWVTNNLTDQMAFAREADPITVEFWKKEAGPVELSFQNLTVAGQRSENDPATRALWERGMEIGAWWAEEDQRNSLAEVKAAEQRLAVAKKRAVANSRPRV